MSRLNLIFAHLKGHRAALVSYLTGGDPTLADTVVLMHTLVAAGTDILEVGMPFSDPMADGPVIQMSHQRALAAGATTLGVLRCVAAFRETDTKTPIVLMGYVNPVEAMGYRTFAQAARDAGVDGVILVDMPPEEALEWREVALEHGVDPIFLLAPTSSPTRLRRISEASRGFVYYVALKGVTGAAHLNIDEVAEKVIAVRHYTDLPVGVGFGIRDPESAARLGQFADAIIVGSAIVSRISAALNQDQAIADVRAFVGSLRAALPEYRVERV